MKEIWYDIEGYESYYQYSNMLRFRSVNRSFVDKRNGIKTMKGRVLKIVKSPKHYATVSLSKNGVVESIQVHAFFAEKFIDNPLNKKYVNHKNGNKHDYSLDNLEWVTKGEDILHAYKMGLRTNKKGKDHWKYGKSGAKGSGNGRSRVVLDLSNGIYYDCIRDAALAKNLGAKNLCRYLNGVRKNKTSMMFV